MIDAARLDAALAATWPAAETAACGPFTLRFGPGGNRVSAATLEAARATTAEIDAAIAAMGARGQVPLFRVRMHESDLDAALAGLGFAPVHDTMFLVAPTGTVAAHPVPPLTAFDIWPPLAIQRALWAADGIGADRCAVMARAAGAKTALLGRRDGRPTGAGFVAVAGDIAMVHALTVPAADRRRGLARAMMAHAARWAARLGAVWMAVAVTRENAAARALYAALGMAEVGSYRYRQAASAHPAQQHATPCG